MNIPKVLSILIAHTNNIEEGEVFYIQDDNKFYCFYVDSITHSQAIIFDMCDKSYIYWHNTIVYDAKQEQTYTVTECRANYCSLLTSNEWYICTYLDLSYEVVDMKHRKKYKYTLIRDTKVSKELE